MCGPGADGSISVRDMLVLIEYSTWIGYERMTAFTERNEGDGDDIISIF